MLGRYWNLCTNASLSMASSASALSKASILTAFLQSDPSDPSQSPWSPSVKFKIVLRKGKISHISVACLDAPFVTPSILNFRWRKHLYEHAAAQTLDAIQSVSACLCIDYPDVAEH